MDVNYAQNDDISGCDDIDKNMSFHTNEEVFNKSLNEKRLIVAKENNVVLGYLRYGYIWDDELPYIQMIRVDKKIQGNGIGKSLVTFLKNELVQKQIKVLISSTDENNEASLLFHTKLGFIECGRLDINEGSEKEIFLKKVLN